MSALKPSSAPKYMAIGFSSRKARSSSTCDTGPSVDSRRVMSEHRKRMWLEPCVVSAARAPQSAVGRSRMMTRATLVNGRIRRMKAVGRKLRPYCW